MRVVERQLPDQIEPFGLARKGTRLQGGFDLGRMERLVKVTAATEAGRAGVDLHFGIDEGGVSHMRGSIQAEITVICQRCMEPMTLSLDLEVSVGFVLSDEQARQISKAYEPCTVKEGQVQLQDLVEEEILLSLPIVPMHEDVNCQHWYAETEQGKEDGDAESDRKNPFAVLAELKKRNS